MKTIAFLSLLVFALFCQWVKADEPSVYDALVEIQKVGSVDTHSSKDACPDQLVNRDSETRPISERGDRFFGWEPTQPEPKVRIERTGNATETSPVMAAIGQTQASGLNVKRYDGPELGANELPYIDAEGFQLDNYGVMLTAEWCGWCEVMYKQTVKPLRDEGYKVFIIDIDQFPDIKDRVYRRDPTAQRMGNGVPYFIVCEGGRTKKVYFGMTSANVIRKHLKKPVEKDKDLYNLR